MIIVKVLGGLLAVLYLALWVVCLMLAWGNIQVFVGWFREDKEYLSRRVQVYAAVDYVLTSVFLVLGPLPAFIWLVACAAVLRKLPKDVQKYIRELDYGE